MDDIIIKTEFLEKTLPVVLIEVGGYIDQSNSDKLQSVFDNLFTSSHFYLIFDLKDLVYMSSAGWGIFVGEVKRFRENGGDIKLMNMNPEIYEVFQMLEFYHILEDYTDTREALSAFGVILPQEKKSKPSRQIKREDSTVDTAKSPPKSSTPDEDHNLQKEKDDEKDRKPKDEIKKSMEETVDLKESHKAAEQIDEQEKITPDDTKDIANSQVDKHSEKKVDSSPPEELSEAEDKKPEKSDDKILFEKIFDEDISISDMKEKKNTSGLGKKINSGNNEATLQKHHPKEIENEPITRPISPSPLRSTVRERERIDISVNLARLPIHEKIRKIVAQFPLLSLRQLRIMLMREEFGGDKIGYLKLYRLLKSLNLESKEKRYRFYRSC